MADQTSFFTLIPNNDEALWMVEQPENREHWGLDLQTLDGDRVQYFKFFFTRQPKIAGQLVSFGRHERNDVRLPNCARSGTGGSAASSVAAGPEVKRGRSYQNYRNDHFFFFLAPSGELILRDLSPCFVQIEIKDATFEEATLYALHGSLERGPRQRVIPRTSREIFITVGSSAYFSLRWSDGLVDDGLGVQTYMAGRAQSLAVSGMTLTEPGSASTEPPGLHSRELRGRFTPAAGLQSGPHKPIHKYAKLGSGSFGAVHKAVDLRTGQLWAVKEIVPPQQGWSSSSGHGHVDRLKACLVKEVENMAKISHLHIVHFEDYQDFRINGTFRIFYKLYDGNLASLISHSCLTPPSAQPAPWMPKLVTQMTTALEYLHSNGILHLDIKPDNILFNTAPGSDGPDFYLGDFGLARAEAELLGVTGIGTPFYMAPEISLGLASPCAASDIWSFAMTLGEALGFWCPHETSLSAGDWVSKLQALGGNEVAYREGSDLFRHANDKLLYRRIASVVTTGALPPMFTDMMLDPANRPTALQCMHIVTRFFIDRPAEPEPLEDWPGNRLPWVIDAEFGSGHASSGSQAGFVKVSKVWGFASEVAVSAGPTTTQVQIQLPQQQYQQRLQQQPQQQHDFKQPTILKGLMESTESPRTRFAQLPAYEPSEKSESFYWYRPRNWAGSQPEDPTTDREADDTGTRPYPTLNTGTADYEENGTAANPLPTFGTGPTPDYSSWPESARHSHRLPNNRPATPRRQPPPPPRPQPQPQTIERPSKRPSQPNFPPTFPAYHCTQNMNEIAAYLANASYVASLAGPPLADLKYGVIIVPAGEESLLFGRSPPNFVVNQEFIDAVDDADRDYDRALRMHDPDGDSAEFVRRRFDDDFPSVEVEAELNVEVGVPEGGGGEGETVEGRGGSYVPALGGPNEQAGVAKEGLGDDDVEGQGVEDSEASVEEDEEGGGVKGLEAAEVGDVEDPAERQSKRQRRCQ